MYLGSVTGKVTHVCTAGMVELSCLRARTKMGKGSTNKHLPVKLIPDFGQVKKPWQGKGSWAALALWVSN